MAKPLFAFVQFELPWELGPPDGRYLVRRAQGPDSGRPEHVVVLGTVGSIRRGTFGRRRRAGTRSTDPTPAGVAVARATVVDAVGLAAESQARAWLSGLDPEREAAAAVAVLNRLLFSYRIASASPMIHEVSPLQALIVRAGFGKGEQVAEGEWNEARELLLPPADRIRRTAALRPHERFAALLSGRDEELLCEELTLRARADLDRGRLHHAAIELDRAYEAALRELPRLRRNDLERRIAELRELHGETRETARAALGELDAGEGERPAIEGDALGPEPDEQRLRHAIERLEAALRARSAAGLV